MYPIGDDGKRLGYWGRRSLRWSPVITAFCYSSCHVTPSPEHELDWLTAFYNRSDGDSFLRLEDRLWLVLLNLCQSLRSLTQGEASFCIMWRLHGRFTQWETKACWELQEWVWKRFFLTSQTFSGDSRPCSELDWTSWDIETGGSQLMAFGFVTHGTVT